DARFQLRDLRIARVWRVRRLARVVHDRPRYTRNIGRARIFGRYSITIHVLYILGAIILAIAAFFAGRSTIQHSQLREIASDPKMAESAKAVNALSAFGQNLSDVPATPP
ncbi:MAG TPA: hypothetical protein VG269_20915, partial [Tepidisphaeraceae bacterium]|nr:hypothetical protein [Tepidisphaeraceae bacterium]